MSQSTWKMELNAERTEVVIWVPLPGVVVEVYTPDGITFATKHFGSAEERRADAIQHAQRHVARHSREFADLLKQRKNLEQVALGVSSTP